MRQAGRKMQDGAAELIDHPTTRTLLHQNHGNPTIVSTLIANRNSGTEASWKNGEAWD